MKEAVIIDACRSPIGRAGGRFALATLCVGGGQGMATIFERENY